jgi:hypothetical protein
MPDSNNTAGATGRNTDCTSVFHTSRKWFLKKKIHSRFKQRFRNFCMKPRWRSHNCRINSTNKIFRGLIRVAIVRLSNSCGYTRNWINDTY